MKNEENKVALRLLNFNFETLHLVVNQSFKWPTNKGVEMDPKISKDVSKIDENHARIKLSFIVEPDQNKPFSALVDLVAIFESDNWEQSELGKIYMNENTINIMFPYLRQAVSTITSLAGLPTYTLPVTNIRNINSNK